MHFFTLSSLLQTLACLEKARMANVRKIFEQKFLSINLKMDSRTDEAVLSNVKNAFWKKTRSRLQKDFFRNFIFLLTNDNPATSKAIKNHNCKTGFQIYSSANNRSLL